MKIIIGKLLFWLTVNVMIFMKDIRANQMHIKSKEVPLVSEPIYGQFSRLHQLG